MVGILLIIIFTALTAAIIIARARDRHPSAVGEQTEKDKKVEPSITFHYRRKNLLMTPAENDFFDTINKAIENNFYVFPQIHLSAILDYKVKYQNWEHARRYINQLSVDYVVCDKEYRKPILVIELDDWSHDNDKRKKRDANVEHILKEAKIQLLRFRNVGSLSEGEIIHQIQVSLPQPARIQPVPSE